MCARVPIPPLCRGSCHPGEELLNPEHASKSLAVAVTRVCCNTKALKERMEALDQLGYNGGPAGTHALLHTRVVSRRP